MENNQISLPHNYVPRPYQIPLLKAWDGGCKRLIYVAHRRCLAEGTKIAMADGTHKNIEDIKIGDTVLSYDGQKLVPNNVINVFDNGYKTVYKYNELEATPNHKVLDNRFKWTQINDSSHLVNAGVLNFGNVHNPEANTKPFNNFLLEKISDRRGLGENKHVYDFEVENTHSYVANGYIVHNCGKDKTVFAQIPKKMMERVGTYFYFLPTYNQARKILWNGADREGFRFLDHFPKEIVRDKNEAEMRITTTNGSILQLVGADNIDRIVGTNPIGVVFSEYSLMKPEVWTLISPILAENGGWAVFVFTPRGQNHAYELLKKAEKNKNWYVEILPVSKTKALPQEKLDEERMNMTEAYFKQEYECDFTENATAVFRNVRARTYEPLEWKFNEGGIYQLGVDLAKANDYTVITPFDYTTFRVGPQDSFNQIDYTLQKAKIEAAFYRFNKARVVMDTTGVGTPVVDDLLNKGINVTPFAFTYNSRNELLVNLQILLEQGKITIPNDPALIEELESAIWDITPQGRSKIVVPDDKHDDRIMSLALAVWDIPTRQVSQRSMQQVEVAGGVLPLYPEWNL